LDALKFGGGNGACLWAEKDTAPNRAKNKVGADGSCIEGQEPFLLVATLMVSSLVTSFAT
jgi:hypothetical protein